MCTRTMKFKKGAILHEANSNTNSIELTVKEYDQEILEYKSKANNIKALDTKSFNYKKQSHVNTKEKNVDK